MTSTQTTPRVDDAVIIDGKAYTITKTDAKRTVCTREVEMDDDTIRTVTTTCGTHALESMGARMWGLLNRIGPRVVNPAAVQAVPAAPQTPRIG